MNGQGLSGPAILVWNNAKNTIIERNVFYNCARGIALGLGGKVHYGGLVRNNMFYRDAQIGDNGLSTVDVAFYVESVGYTQVIHNTIIVQDSYYAPIEIRYDYTNDTFIANNIIDTGIINFRNDAIANLQDNDVGNANSAWFVDMNNGDLHLVNNSDIRLNVIAKGVLLTNGEYDFDGQSRNKHGNGNVDLGADEISSIICDEIVDAPATTVSDMNITIETTVADIPSTQIQMASTIGTIEDIDSKSNAVQNQIMFGKLSVVMFCVFLYSECPCI